MCKIISDQEVLQLAIKTWGIEMQENMAIEEMAELTKELIKKRRGRHNRSEIIKEIADVGIMILQLTEIYGEDEINEIYEKKLNRLRGLLNVQTN